MEPAIPSFARAADEYARGGFGRRATAALSVAWRLLRRHPTKGKRYLVAVATSLAERQLRRGLVCEANDVLIEAVHRARSLGSITILLSLTEWILSSARTDPRLEPARREARRSSELRFHAPVAAQ